MTVDNFSPARDAILAHHQELRFSDVLRDAYRIRFVARQVDAKAFDTACWCFDKVTGAHVLAFGEALVDKLVSGRVADYALAYYYHEVEHSLSTVRDLQSLAVHASAAGVPFRLLNLAEDARIEALARARWGRRFGWLSHEDPATGDEPAQILFQIIQSEDMNMGARFMRDKDVARRFERVCSYYERFVAAPDTWAIVSILQEWVAEFGPPPEKNDGRGAGDLEQALVMQIDPGALSDLEASIRPSEDSGGGEVAEQLHAAAVDGNHDFLTGAPRESLDPELVARLCGILRASIARGPAKMNTSTPTKRLRLAALVRGSSRIFRGKEPSNRGNKRRLVVYYDCSGSMAHATVAGKHLVAALGQLAGEGHVDGHIVLTKGEDGKACHQVLRLSSATEWAAAIPADGECECFEPALRATTRLLTPGSLVLGYTDGNITDEPIARDRWHGRGVFSIGGYVGADQSAKLHHWFDSAMCSENVEDFARCLASELARKRSP